MTLLANLTYERQFRHRPENLPKQPTHNLVLLAGFASSTTDRRVIQSYVNDQWGSRVTVKTQNHACERPLHLPSTVS